VAAEAGRVSATTEAGRAAATAGTGRAAAAEEEEMPLVKLEPLALSPGGDGMEVDVHDTSAAFKPSTAKSPPQPEAIISCVVKMEDMHDEFIMDDAQEGDACQSLVVTLPVAIAAEPSGDACEPSAQKAGPSVTDPEEVAPEDTAAGARRHSIRQRNKYVQHELCL
jgi:hypothetical protein